ncbi:hypothetical protein [Gloeobacter morelensis]|uniref:Uncharacterized protein n=1 Tax=Gloeobacter morelensis MG652769 TaxID=2781736 RepID=A0ABY3PH84_9CYAN|nr:hypothetical protein [Gloeobacter morelensis]UFP92978.1 hypothetical protein ISF26_14260 [Gloeobacter morelensis MG652769]
MPFDAGDLAKAQVQTAEQTRALVEQLACRLRWSGRAQAHHPGDCPVGDRSVGCARPLLRQSRRDRRLRRLRRLDIFCL